MSRMEQVQKESKLSIKTNADGTQSEVDIAGTGQQTVFNLALLTRDVSNQLGVPYFVLLSVLHGAIQEYDRSGFASETKVDLCAIRKAGKQP